MNNRDRLFTSAMKFMMEHGFVVAATTIAGGIALGPEGAALGTIAVGVGSLITSPWWRRFTQMLISNLHVLYPFLRDRMHLVTDLLEAISELIVRLMQRTGFLPTSEVRAIMSNNRRDSSPTR